MPITSSTALTAVNFIKSIIFRFGVPHNIITDNGTNFTAAEFQNSCEELGIKINYASVIRPKRITILYCDFTLFIDIFHFKLFFLCCFGLFYIVYTGAEAAEPEFSGKKWIPSC